MQVGQHSSTMLRKANNGRRFAPSTTTGFSLKANRLKKILFITEKFPYPLDSGGRNQDV